MSTMENNGTPELNSNDQKYCKFLKSVLAEHKLAPPAEIYHHVRQIPYGSAGQRDPQQVYENNRGTCSGKHILLRDLLRTAGYEADVLSVFTYFNKGIPSHASMPLALQRLIEQELVPDFHNVVLLSLRGLPGSTDNLVILDATWNDRMGSYGFPVNRHWEGVGDTILAGEIIRREPICEDVVSQKKKLLSEFTKDEHEIRQQFLELLTGWIADLPPS